LPPFLDFWLVDGCLFEWSGTETCWTTGYWPLSYAEHFAPQRRFGSEVDFGLLFAVFSGADNRRQRLHVKKYSVQTDLRADEIQHPLTFI